MRDAGCSQAAGRAPLSCSRVVEFRFIHSVTVVIEMARRAPPPAISTLPLCSKVCRMNDTRDDEIAGWRPASRGRVI